MDFDAPANDDPKELRREIAKYPTDLRLRFRLGAALSARGDYMAAVPELQKGMCNPHLRLQAMKLLIEVYEASGQSDLATRMREQFSKESGNEGSSGSALVQCNLDIGHATDKLDSWRPND
jgi:thioredoxin-like negative regulator of GroEL